MIINIRTDRIPAVNGANCQPFDWSELILRGPLILPKHGRPVPTNGINGGSSGERLSCPNFRVCHRRSRFRIGNAPSCLEVKEQRTGHLKTGYLVGCLANVMQKRYTHPREKSRAVNREETGHIEKRMQSLKYFFWSVTHVKLGVRGLLARGFPNPEHGAKRQSF
jgi:hypothetical protein